MINKEKLENNLPHYPFGELGKVQMEIRTKLYEYNNTFHLNENNEKKFSNIIKSFGKNSNVLAPFTCDYGFNITIGENSFINYGAKLLDTSAITIGNQVFIGPNFSAYTPIHPTEYEDRNTYIEWGKPITIQDNVWIGGSVTILPGVTIGSGSVIGAGSVVTKDIPCNVLAFGNPCKVQKSIDNDVKK